MEEDMKEKKTRAKKPVKKQQPKTKHREKIVFYFKLFGKWDAVEVLDPSLKGYINTEGIHKHGRQASAAVGRQRKR